MPLLVYHQQSEGVWLNHALARQDQNEQRLRSLGALMGLTIANQCQLDLRLPELFFHMLTTPCYSPARTELANLDAAFAAQIERGRHDGRWRVLPPACCRCAAF